MRIKHANTLIKQHFTLMAKSFYDYIVAYTAQSRRWRVATRREDFDDFYQSEWRSFFNGDERNRRQTFKSFNENCRACKEWQQLFDQVAIENDFTPEELIFMQRFCDKRIVNGSDAHRATIWFLWVTSISCALWKIHLESFECFIRLSKISSEYSSCFVINSS